MSKVSRRSLSNNCFFHTHIRRWVRSVLEKRGNLKLLLNMQGGSHKMPACFAFSDRIFNCVGAL